MMIMIVIITKVTNYSGGLQRSHHKAFSTLDYLVLLLYNRLSSSHYLILYDDSDDDDDSRNHIAYFVFRAVYDQLLSNNIFPRGTSTCPISRDN